MHQFKVGDKVLWGVCLDAFIVTDIVAGSVGLYMLDGIYHAHEDDLVPVLPKGTPPPLLGFYPGDINPETVSCVHNFTEYTGFTEVYTYCTKCDLRLKDDI